MTLDDVLANELDTLHELEIKLAEQNGKVQGLRAAQRLIQPAPPVPLLPAPAPPPRVSAAPTADATEEPLHGFTRRPKRGRPPKKPAAAHVGEGPGPTGPKDAKHRGPLAEQQARRRKVQVEIATLLSQGARRQYEIARYLEMNDATAMNYLQNNSYFARNKNMTWRLTDQGKCELLGAKEGGHPVVGGLGDDQYQARVDLAQRSNNGGQDH